MSKKTQLKKIMEPYSNNYHKLIAFVKNDSIQRDKILQVWPLLSDAEKRALVQNSNIGSFLMDITNDESLLSVIQKMLIREGGHWSTCEMRVLEEDPSFIIGDTCAHSIRCTCGLDSMRG